MSDFYIEFPEPTDDLLVYYDPETGVVRMVPKNQSASESTKEWPEGWKEVGYTEDTPASWEEYRAGPPKPPVVKRRRKKK